MSENVHSAAQAAALAALIAGATNTQAAAVAAVSEKTISRWREQEDFRRELEEARSAALECATTRLGTAATAAVNVLVGVMQSPTATAAAKVSAARVVLELSLNYMEAVHLEGRVTALEELAKSEGRGKT